MSTYASWMDRQRDFRDHERLSYVWAMKDKMLRFMAGRLIAGTY